MDNREWVTAKVALDILCGDGSDRSAAANALRDYAAGGSVEAIAGTIIVIEDCGFGVSGVEAERSTCVPIPALMWSRVETVYEHDLKGWSSGSFTLNHGYNKAASLGGVKFRRDAVADLGKAYGPFSAPFGFGSVAGAAHSLSASQPPSKPKGGRIADKHGEPLAIFTLRLYQMDRAALNRLKATGDDTIEMLRAAYEEGQVTVPAKASLEGIAAGALRVVKKRRNAEG